LELLRCGAHDLDRSPVDYKPADLQAVLEAHLNGPSGPHLPHIVPVERQLVEFVTFKFQGVFIQRNQLTLQPFAGLELNPVELVRRRGWRLKGCLGRCRVGVGVCVCAIALMAQNKIATTTTALLGANMRSI
jgi:hypothetical protein